MKKDGLGDRLHREKALGLVSQYENMLKNNESHFFGPDSFEHIIEYYEEHLEVDKALGVVEYARNQYPFSAVPIKAKGRVNPGRAFSKIKDPSSKRYSKVIFFCKKYSTIACAPFFPPTSSSCPKAK